MPAKKRFSTKYAGVYYIQTAMPRTKKLERVYYVMYRKNGKLIEEKVGRQFRDAMTPARAAGKRAKRLQGEELSNAEQREAKLAAEKAKAGQWTVNKLFQEYIKGRPDNNAKATDQGRYNNYLKSAFGSKKPHDLVPLDIDRLRINLSKKLAPQTVKHILNLLTWIINYGVRMGLCKGIPFSIKKPKVNNLKTEDLTAQQLTRLLKAIEADSNIQAGNIMKLALFTGMRRSEIFKLQWKDIDFDRAFIHIRDPKGGPAQIIPLNDAAKVLLETMPKNDSPLVFPGLRGRQKTVLNKRFVKRIKKQVGLPSDFRPLHGLRHTYASMLASSGKVDLYTLQKLLTHKSPVMTQRYAHLADEALKRAADLAGDLINQSVNQKDDTSLLEEPADAATGNFSNK